MLLGGCSTGDILYTGSSEKYYNSRVFSHKTECNISVMVQANSGLFTFFKIINLTVFLAEWNCEALYFV